MPGVYDDEKVSKKELHDLEDAYAAPASTQSGSSKLAEQEALQNAYNQPAATESGSSKLNNSGSTETAATATAAKGASKNKASESEEEESGEPQSLANKLKGMSPFKKRMAIASTFAGGSLVAGIIAFFMLLPLKIEHIIQNADQYFGAAASQALDKQGEKFFNGYVAAVIIPALTSGQCYRVADPSCVNGPDNPVNRLYRSWKQGNLEDKLVKNHGIIFARDNNSGRLTMTVNGTQHDLERVRTGQASVFDLDGADTTTRTAAHRAIKDAIKDETFWKRNYHRFVYSRYLKNQYGSPRCLIKCDTRDRVRGSYDQKKLAAKAFLIQRMMPEKAGIIMQCVLLGCNTDLEPATEGERRRMTQAEKDMRDLMRDTASRFSNDIPDLVERSQDISQNGMTKVFAREGVKKVVSQFAGDAAAQQAGRLAEKAVPVIGWIFLIGEVVHLAENAGPMLRYIGYATSAATAIQIYSTFQTVSAECKSGNCDPTVLGSFSTVLETNMTGSDEDRFDASQSTMYNHVMGGNLSGPQVATSFLNPFSMGTASAAEPPKVCEGEKAVPAGELVCPTEKFAAGNEFATELSNWVKGVPGLGLLGDLVNAINGALAPAFEAAYDVACTTGRIITLGLADPCGAFEDAVSAIVGPLLDWLGDKIISSPISKHMSGARTVDMLFAGADAANNQVCRDELGCKRATKEQVYQTRKNAYAAARTEFEQQSFFARMFNTESQYSLISRMAIAMPSNMRTAGTRTVAAFASNPFSTFGAVLNSILGHNNVAFAATGPMEDPFQIPQFIIPDSEIPDNPGTYWEATCNDPQHNLRWLNEDNYQDELTGQQTTNKVNPCLLIEKAAVAYGASMDPKIVPPDDQGLPATPPAGPAPDAGGDIPTGDAITLANQIINSPNISFQTFMGEAAFKTIASTGKATQCGSPAIDPRLLGVILKLSNSYKLVLGVAVDNHSCDGGFHPKGMAIDINGVNPLNGGVGTGNNIRFEPAEMPILQQFYGTAGQVLLQAGGGGLGQVTSCINPSQRAPRPVSYFNDTCNHIHLDVGRR